MAANEDEIQRVAHALRQSTKVLTRNLQVRYMMQMQMGSSSADLQCPVAG